EAAVELGVDSLEHGPDVPIDSLRALGSRNGAWTPTLLTVWRDGRAHSPTASWQRGHYREALAAALDAGVTVLAGTDAAGAGTLAAGSSSARAYLGHPGLVVGAAADVVTYHDDPREDLSALRRPAAIVRRG